MDNTTTSRKALFAMSFLALGLTACGGGGSNTPCQSTIPGLCSALNPTGSQTGGGTSSATSASSLFTTAPSAITLAYGGSASYSIGGGLAPYTATSGNTSVATATASGTTLTINGISAGSAQLFVVDSVGKSAPPISVTVLATGQAGIPPSISPAALTVGDCTTNIPFVFKGGTAPYTILTSDNVVVPVSSALPLGADSYFLASIRSLYLSGISDAEGKVTVSVPRVATVSVLDSQSRVAAASITIASATPTCPNNPLLTTAPASVNARATEILAIQIAGGVAPFSVTSSDASIVTVPAGNLPASSFSAQATPSNRSTQANALLTVTSSDGQKSIISFTVFP